MTVGSAGLTESRTRSLARAVALAVSVALLTAASPALAQTNASKAWHLSKAARKAQNNSLRYLHSTWFRSTYQTYTYVPVSSIVEATQTAQSGGFIRLLRPRGGFTVQGSDEQAMIRRIPAWDKTSPSTTRQQASVLYATALALGNNTYDPRRVGVNRSRAIERAVAWTNALALAHARHEWGLSWQSPLWAYYMGAGSKKIWGRLPDCTRQLVSKAVADEADRLLDVPPPYHRDASGTVLTPGDSKAEENGWNAALLFLAARMYQSAAPTRAAEWEAQGRWYALSANAMPDQVGTDPRIAGSNVNPDGTVTNHDIIHPDYMASVGEMQAKYLLTTAWSRTGLPWECSNRFVNVWQALTVRKFPVGVYWRPGGVIYRVGRRGVATANIYYPQGSDWSRKRKHTFALMDVTVFVAGQNSGYKWGKAHLTALLGQQARHKDGHILNRGESRFMEEEQFGAACTAEMVELLRQVR